jgi:hypothetical protein
LKQAISILVFLLAVARLCAQEPATTEMETEQGIENITAQNDAAPEDDAWLQQLSYYRKHPLPINRATAEDLAALHLLSAWQVEQLINYRRLLGKFINRYELQAIPGWDLPTIRKLLPYITVTDDKTIAASLKDRLTGGDQFLLARTGRLLEKANGYDTGRNRFLGSRDKLLLRYSYRYANLLQWGWLADKDAGEQLFKGSQRQGFDFYSVHFFARRLGIIKALALGDFTVNFGQGLIQWQNLAFKKSSDITAVKRQSATLRPYSSSGEYNFHRGAGITLQKRNWELTLFASYKKISANLSPDTALGDVFVSSLLSGGYHRTAAENDNRNKLQQTAGGAALQYKGQRWHAGMNAVYYHFSVPLQKNSQPYNLFALQGSSFLNTSVDYSYTWRNIHLFGEAAIDRWLHTAIVQGAVISLDATAAVSLVYRNISRQYQSVNANAFTESTLPVNEKGLYTGCIIRPFATLKLEAYADFFVFPWLKYRVDAPSAGKDFLLQASYTPSKLTTLCLRYKSETKMLNSSDDAATLSAPAPATRKNLRLQSSMQLNPQWSLRNRVELLWYKTGAYSGEGFLTFQEIAWNPLHPHWSCNGRLQYFETGSFNERIYTYENDLPYHFSVPFFYGKGWRYYINVLYRQVRISRPASRPLLASFGFRWGQTLYPDKRVNGSGADEINAAARSSYAIQFILHN